jgi:hypothetical protein
LDNADKSKFGSILTGLNTLQSLGNNQYPKTITESNNILSNHGFEVTPKSENNGKAQNKNSEGKEGKDNDKEDEEVNRSFAQVEGKCYSCGKAGHKSPSRCEKNKPKDIWAIKKAQQSHAQVASPDASILGTVSVPIGQATTPPRSHSSGGSHSGWAGAHIKMQFHQQAAEMRN